MPIFRLGKYYRLKLGSRRFLKDDRPKNMLKMAIFHEVWDSGI